MLAAGMSYDAVAETLNVPKSTVQGWAEKVEEIIGKRPGEVRANEFDARAQATACAIMHALEVQADLAGDRTWLGVLLTSPAEGVRNVERFTKSVADRLTSLLQFAQGIAPEQLPGDGPRAIEAEIVDA